LFIGSQAGNNYRANKLIAPKTNNTPPNINRVVVGIKLPASGSDGSGVAEAVGVEVGVGVEDGPGVVVGVGVGVTISHSQSCSPVQSAFLQELVG